MTMDAMMVWSATARVDFLQRRVFSWHSSHFQAISATGFLRGHGIPASRPAFRLERNKRVHLVHAASKGPKPPPKPASRNAIIASIVVPILLAGSAFGAGKIMLARIVKEAMEEAEELERKIDPRRLLTDGKSEEERKKEKDDAAVSASVPSTRNRPKREE